MSNPSDGDDVVSVLELPMNASVSIKLDGQRFIEMEIRERHYVAAVALNYEEATELCKLLSLRLENLRRFRLGQDV